MSIKLMFAILLVVVVAAVSAEPEPQSTVDASNYYSGYRPYTYGGYRQYGAGYDQYGNGYYGNRPNYGSGYGTGYGTGYGNGYGNGYYNNRHYGNYGNRPYAG